MKNIFLSVLILIHISILSEVSGELLTGTEIRISQSESIEHDKPKAPQRYDIPKMHENDPAPQEKKAPDVPKRVDLPDLEQPSNPVVPPIKPPEIFSVDTRTSPRMALIDVYLRQIEAGSDPSALRQFNSDEVVQFFLERPERLDSLDARALVALTPEQINKIIKGLSDDKKKAPFKELRRRISDIQHNNHVPNGTKLGLQRLDEALLKMDSPQKARQALEDSINNNDAWTATLILKLHPEIVKSDDEDLLNSSLKLPTDAIARVLIEALAKNNRSIIEKTNFIDAVQKSPNLAPLLVKLKVPTTHIWKLGYTPLMTEVNSPEIDMNEIDKTLKDAPYITLTNTFGDTALILAVARDTTPAGLITKLLNTGSQINHANDLGQTALMLAAKAGNTEAVKQLLSRGADSTKTDLEGRTAADYTSDPHIQSMLRNSK